MRRLRVPLITIVAILSVVIASQAQTQSLLTRHVRQETLNGQAPLVSHLSATQSMRLVLVLPHRNQAELDDLLKELYDPQSTSYRKFLTVEEFTARFGPSQEDYDAVIRFAEANGFTVVGTSPNHMNLDISGSVANVEAAFHLTMGVYQHPTETRTFFAPDREPTPELLVQLWHVSGLDNYSTPRPGVVRRDASVETAGSTAGTGSGPDNSFLGSDMRAAYYGGSALTGKGQSVGLFELRGTDLADLATYYANVGQTNDIIITDRVTLVPVDTQSTSCVFTDGCDDTQQTIDLTQVLGIAPDMSGVVMYIGTGGLTGQTVDDAGIFNAMATAKPLNAQLSNSWHWEPADPTVDDPYFKEFAAQGQNFFQAAGDNGRWSPSSEAWPEDSPYVTSVGGTALKTTRAGGAWSSETAWSDGGGGISPDLFPIPSWQVGTAEGCVDCSKTYRNGPDVSANAAFSYYVCADQRPCTANLFGGTGFAAPMWAGYLALANQQYLSSGTTSTTLGFINPPLYTIGLGSNRGVFHDIIKGGNGFPATKGYDLATGWGSPDGSTLIDSLAGTPAPGFSFSASPPSVTVAPGNSGSSTIVTDITAGFDSSINLSATGLPKGSTTSFAPKSIAKPGAGTSVWSLYLPSNTPGGTWDVTINATGGGLKHSITVPVTISDAPTFTLNASPNTIMVAPGENGTSTITTAISGGFNSSIDLWATGQPKGVTTTFDPKSIAAPGLGTSIWTVAVPSTTPAGTYPLTLIGTGGGKNITTSFTLAVTGPDFSFTILPKTETVDRGGFGTYAITSKIVGGFDGPITFSAAAKGGAETITFGPNPIKKPGSGKSTMTVKLGSNAVLGPHTITITGTGGGKTHSETVGLKIVK